MGEIEESMMKAMSFGLSNRKRDVSFPKKWKSLVVAVGLLQRLWESVVVAEIGSHF